MKCFNCGNSIGYIEKTSISEEGNFKNLKDDIEILREFIDTKYYVSHFRFICNKCKENMEED